MATTVNLTTTPTQLDDGTAASLYITNTSSSSAVYLTRGTTGILARLRAGQAITVTPESQAVSAYTDSLSGASISLVTTAQTTNTPSTGAATPAWQFAPETYGGVADVVVLHDIATTSGSATITSASGGFAALTSGMKAVICSGSTAGAAQYVTLTKVSSTTATMSTTATATTSACLGMYGSDSSSAVNQAVAAATTYAQAHDGYAEVVLAGMYGMGSAPAVGGAPAGNAYVPLPIVATTARKVTLAFRGKGTAQALAHWQQTSPQVVGSGLVCLNGAGSVDSTYGPTSLIGGPYAGYGGPTTVFNNMLVVLDGVTAVVPFNGTCGGFDFFGVGEVLVKDAACFALAVVPTSGAPVPSMGNPTVFSNFGYFGLRMPSSTNNALAVVDKFSVEGLVNGFRPSEHTVFTSVRIINCYAGVAPYHGSGGAMSNRIHGYHCTLENCTHGIATIESSGVLVRMDIDHLEAESLADIVNDANSNLQGRMGFAGYGLTLSPSNVIVGSGFSVYDLKAATGPQSSPSLPASTTALTNPFYRDAAVTVSGGTVTAITVGGTATGLTSGTVIVPSGKTIAITYSSAPTWVWNTF